MKKKAKSILAKAALAMAEASLATAAALEGKSDRTIRYEQKQQCNKIISVEATTEVTATTSTAMKLRVKKMEQKLLHEKDIKFTPSFR